MKVTGIQADLAWEDPEANRRALLPRIEEAAAGGSRLVVLPETWATGFTLRAEDFAEPEGGPNETFLRETSQRLGIALAGSIQQRTPGGGRPRNVLVFCRPGQPPVRYAKIHTFTFHGESDHYAAGDEAVTVEFEGVRITPLICFDLRFPELFAPLAGDTDLFVVVANWPAVRGAHWRALLVARAIECQSFVLGVNRVGDADGHSHSGDSALVSPLGEIVAAAPPGVEALITGPVDPAEVRRVRESLPFLADRRPDLYARLRSRD